MPLLAVDTGAGTRTIDLTDVDGNVWSEIWRQRTGERLRCRSCAEPLIAKQMSQTGLRFFAHRHAVPGCPSHGETARHLHLKALFVAALRSTGWAAELEVVGDGWRADVLATGADGRRVAVEVQLASITRDAVAERMRRHAAQDVTTMWVVAKRASWAHELATVLVDERDFVEATVLTSHRPQDRPALAGPASIGRFVQRWAEGRVTPVRDSEGLWAREGRCEPAIRYMQLDGCLDSYLIGAAERRAADDARRAELEQRQAEATRVRQLQKETMLISLRACRRWFKAQSELNIWFGGGFRARPEDAVEARWDPEIGIIVCIGLYKPSWVLAMAEPRRRSPRSDARVAAWTTGSDPSTVATEWPLMYGVETRLDLRNADLKRVSHRRR